MHRIHVRTGYIEVPPVTPYDERPTHDQFIIPTGPNEEVVDLEVLEAGYAEPPQPFDELPRKVRMKRWRFRAVSVEKIDVHDVDSGDDIIIDVDPERGVVSEESVRRLLGPAGGA
jgi:hypothetical protein